MGISAIGSKGHHTFTLDVWENSTNTENNTSNCGYSFTMWGGTWDFNYSSKFIYWSLDIGGTTYNGKFGTYTKNTTLTISTGSLNIGHESDGTKTIAYSFSVTDGIGASYTTGNCSASGSLGLSSIPRASQPSCITWPNNTENVGDMGNTITIHMNRKSDYFTHTVRYSWYNTSGTIATGVTTNCSWTIPLSFANDIPNATQSWGTIYVDTYNGSTLIGTKSCKFVTSVPSYIVPAIGDISWTKTSGEPDSWPMTQMVSQGNISMVNVTGAYGSTIKTYSLTFAGLNSNSSSLTVNNIASSGTLEAIATVTDSRNRSATRKVSFSVSAYTKPALTTAVYRCDATGNEDDSGEYMYVNASVTITEIGNNAIQSIVLQYKKHSDYLYTSVALSNNTPVIIDASSDYTWDWIITASDKIYPVSDNNSISTGEVVLDILANGRGIAFGKVAEEEDVIDIHWGMKLLGQYLSDFIIEQGTSGIWTYRKWYSGIAECWGKGNVPVTCTNQQGGGYFSDNKSIALPSGLFTQAIMGNAECGDPWCWTGNISVSTSYIYFKVIKSDPYNIEFSPDIHMFVKGKWK